MTRNVVVIGLLLSAAISAFSQARVQFEVASVKPSDPNDPRTMYDTNEGRFRARGTTVKSLISLAWDKQMTQISGGPKWLDSDRFDIDARPGNAGLKNLPRLEMYGQIKAMLRSLLKDRFDVVVHSETRQEPVYELVVAKGGSRLKETSVPEAVPNQSVGRGQIIAVKTPLPRFTLLLSPLVNRQVIDKTGLTGWYDFTLTYALDAGQIAALGPDAPRPVDPDAPSIFTALEEQLGLKLESARGPVEVLVIDRAQKPEAN